MSLVKEHLYVVILCGGGGTRLWPLSRSHTPKQFIELVGEETLFEKTLRRAEALVDNHHIYIMTNQQYEEDVRKFAPDVPVKNIISEPEKKNTALAMGVAAGIIHVRDSQAVVINFASDHLIGDLAEFNQTVLAAAEVAANQKEIVSVGIQPTFPHSGLGYIHRGAEQTQLKGYSIYQVEGFREKPNVETATTYLATGKYYWNANLYTWSTKVILQEFAEHSPTIYAHIKSIMAAVDTNKFAEIFAKEYRLSPEEQIDTAISEKTKHLVVIPGDFGWTDIGSWNVVHDEVAKDKDQNALIRREEGAEWMSFDTKGSLVSTGRKLIVTIGVENLVIVDTPDALLITTKSRAQEVKKVVEKLTTESRDTLL